MDPLLRTAVVTAAWLVVQGLIGLLGLRGRRPYKGWRVAVHIVVFVFTAAGWFYTVSGLSAVSGNRIGSWISEVVMGAAILWLLVGGVILTAGRKVPAPVRLVGSHLVATVAALAGSVVGIVCIALGA